MYALEKNIYNIAAAVYDSVLLRLKHIYKAERGIK